MRSECVQSVFRVHSVCVQSVFRVCSILMSFHHLAHLVCQFLAFFVFASCLFQSHLKMVEPKKSVVNEDFKDNFDFKLFAVESSFRISCQVLCFKVMSN